MDKGRLIIFSAPSGSGKTTIVKHLIKNSSQYGFSISATTRSKRENEVDGRDYYFLDIEEFKEKLLHHEFVEWEEVYPDTFYGTLKSEIERIWKEGKHVIFDVDVKGGINLKKHYKKKALALFVKVPSLEVLEKRLRQRNTDSQESIKKRLSKAKYELSFEDKFDCVIVNDDLPMAIEEAERQIETFLKRELISKT